jgi:hypothetical protein
MTDAVTLAYDDPDPAATIRAGVVGLQPTDVIRNPGYPSTAFKIATFSVLREGVVVARVYQLHQFHVVTCAGSGIAPVASTTSASPPTLTATIDAPDDGSIPGLALSYGDASSKVGAQGGRWPGVDAFPMPLYIFDGSVAPGAVVSIAGNATDVTGHLEVLDQDLRQTGETISLDLGSGSADLPTTAGSYGLSLTGSWPRGTASFYVVVDIGDVAQPSTTPTPEVQATTALLKGTASQLACSAEDRMPIGVQGNVINQPAGESYVRVNITGILQSDVLQHTEIFGSTQGYWTVTRDGNVVAVIADPELEGFACRGSGIGGA